MITKNLLVLLLSVSAVALVSIILIYLNEMLITTKTPEQVQELPQTFMTRHVDACRIFSIIYNQHNCDACTAFAFSTAASMRLCLEQGVDFIPSPFRMFDCGRGTCNGGAKEAMMIMSMWWGVTDITDSPHVFGYDCNNKSGGKTTTRSEYDFYVLGGYADIVAMKYEILLHGPVVGGIWIDNAFSTYKDGIYYYQDVNLTTTPKNHHAVVVVGWGSHPEPYWIIKNSWGRKWGMNGIGLVSASSITTFLKIQTSTSLLNRLIFYVMAFVLNDYFVLFGYASTILFLLAFLFFFVDMIISVSKYHISHPPPSVYISSNDDYSLEIIKES